MSNAQTEIFMQTRFEALMERSWIAESEVDEYSIAEIDEYLARGGTIHSPNNRNCMCVKCWDFAESLGDEERGN